jgi:hypothetical protein
MPILYAQYHDTVLNLFVEYPPNQYPQVAEVCSRIIRNIPLSEKVKKTYEAPNEDQSIHLVSDGSKAYICVAEDTPLRVCYGFLKSVSEMVSEKDEKALLGVLRERMEFHNNMSNDAMGKLQKELDDVKDIMMENMEKVLEIGEKLDVMLDRSQALADQASQFHGSTRQLKRRYLLRYWKTVGVVVLVIIVLLLLVAMSVCGPTFSDCGGSS